MNFNLLRKLTRIPWIWQQPLTQIPKSDSTVSDLFVWRNSRDWRTFFELINIPMLIMNKTDSISSAVSLVLFDCKGVQISTIELEITGNYRKTINLESYLQNINDEFGTFAIFHKSIPLSLKEYESYLTERGYTSYQYQEAPLRSYVHGNLDAIAQNLNGNKELLGCSSFLKREYRLQVLLTPGSLYQLCFTNPTKRRQNCKIKLVSIKNNKELFIKNICINPGAVNIINLEQEVIEDSIVIIESNMIMARPLVFQIQNLRMDVFHG